MKFMINIKWKPSIKNSINMDIKINISDKVLVGDRIGEIIKIDNISDNRQAIKVAFEEGPPQTFICPTH